MTQPALTDHQARIAILRRQEEVALFDDFNEATAFQLGSAVMAIAIAEHAPVIVNIRTPNRCLFHASLPGSSADNDEWARRKSNVTLRFQQSSLLFGQVLSEKGRSVSADIGLDLMDYAAHGGSFPIRTAKNGLVLAAITVSGLPQIEDHRMAVQAIGSYLGIQPPVYL